MNVPFLRLDSSFEEVSEIINASIERVLGSGEYVLGREVKKFEKELSDYIGAKFSSGVGSGLSALSLALRACGVVPGDEVLVPSFTFIATWLAVSEIGAIPVPVDICPDSAQMDINRLERRISKKTKAIVIVHLYGCCSDIDEILRIGREHDLSIVEDAAQAMGTRYGKKKIGTHGADATAWSFYPGKNLGGIGDGGAVTTNDWEIDKRVKMLRNYGSTEKYVHDVKGVNSRLSPINAVVLSAKLTRLDKWNSLRRKFADLYLSGLKSDRVTPIKVLPLCDPSWHLFVVRSECRGELKSYLAKEGIQTLVHYPIPPHRQSAYSEYKDAYLPNAEKLSSTVLSLPMGPHLTVEQVEYTVDILNSF